MRLHPRYQTERRAALEVQEAVLAVGQKHDLTAAEMVRICTELTMFYAKVCVRVERHGRDDTKADEA